MIIISVSPKDFIVFMHFRSQVAKVVSEKFNEVFKDGNSPKVLAAFVLAKFEEGGSSTEPMLEVVSIGTGTKCITGETIDHKVCTTAQFCGIQ